MPHWIIQLCTIAVIGILASFAYFLKWAGIEFALGFSAGFAACYIGFKNWRQDYENERTPHFTD